MITCQLTTKQGAQSRLLPSRGYINSSIRRIEHGFAVWLQRPGCTGSRVSSGSMQVRDPHWVLDGLVRSATGSWHTSPKPCVVSAWQVGKKSCARSAMPPASALLGEEAASRKGGSGECVLFGLRSPANSVCKRNLYVHWQASTAPAHWIKRSTQYASTSLLSQTPSSSE